MGTQRLKPFRKRKRKKRAKNNHSASNFRFSGDTVGRKGSK